MCLTRVNKILEYVLQNANHFDFISQYDWRDPYDHS